MANSWWAPAPLTTWLFFPAGCPSKPKNGRPLPRNGRGCPWTLLIRPSQRQSDTVPIKPRAFEKEWTPKPMQEWRRSSTAFLGFPFARDLSGITSTTPRDTSLVSTPKPPPKTWHRIPFTGWVTASGEADWSGFMSLSFGGSKAENRWWSMRATGSETQLQSGMVTAQLKRDKAFS